MPTNTRSAAPAPAGLRLRPGRWVDDWAPEDESFWRAGGRRAAAANLRWSVLCEFLGFAVWQLWSVVAVQLPAAGFDLDTGQVFWLISVPSLVGATLRLPYTFAVARWGGRNWTVASALLLVLPAAALAWAVSDPATPFPVLLLAAALAGLGGGNFASSMANITHFFPAREKGRALGLNAAGGNLGAAAAQLAVPVAVSALGGAALALPAAGLLWIPLLLLAAWGASRHMHNLTGARSDGRAMLSAVREPHLWCVALVYIGTFGSFVGFSAVFPQLILDTYPQFAGLPLAGATVSLAFLGPLVGSLARPLGGRLADAWGGARVTVAALALMATAAAAVVPVLSAGRFGPFLGLFLLLFAAAGLGNGSAYRMLPALFALRGDAGGVGAGRRCAAALGIVSAIGAYGGFLVPQALGASATATGGYSAGFAALVGAYAALGALTWALYLRRGAALAGAGV